MGCAASIPRLGSAQTWPSPARKHAGNHFLLKENVWACHAASRRIDYHALFHAYDSEQTGRQLSMADVARMCTDLAAAAPTRSDRRRLVAGVEEAMRCLSGDEGTAVTPWQLAVHFVRLIDPAERATARVARPPILIVADPGPDPDDVKVIILAQHFHREGEIDVRGIVCNGGNQARERAALARAVVRLGTGDDEADPASITALRIAAGTNGTQQYTPSPHEYAVEGFDEELAALDRRGDGSDGGDSSDGSDGADGGALGLEVLREVGPRSLIVQVQAGFTDVAKLIAAEPDLFERKVAWVSIMGGLSHRDDASSEAEAWHADSAQNNVFDMEAARRVYAFCIARRIPMNVVSRESVPNVPMILVEDLHRNTGHPLMKYLYDAQTLGLVGLWGKVCRQLLPARCTKEWYFTTFCGTTREEYEEHYQSQCEANPEEIDIVQYLRGTVKPYDVVCFMLNLASTRHLFDFEAARVVIDGMSHHFYLHHAQMPPKQPVCDFLESHFALVAKRNGSPTPPALRRSSNGARSSDSDAYRGGATPGSVSGVVRPAAGLGPRDGAAGGVGSVAAPGSPRPVWAAAEAQAHIHAEVVRLLMEEWPKEKNSSLLDTWRNRDAWMRSTGPPCVVVHWETLARLGRIPRSDEGLALPLAEAAEIARVAGKRFFIEMFSHRWCSQGQPDDADNSKAKALVQWAKYRWSTGFASFFWIDFSCIDQGDVSPGVAMLPLYVASCNNILCFESIGYEGRAWCRIERAMFAAFCAPTHDIIAKDFVFDGDATQQPVRETTVALTDATQGRLSYPGDMEIITTLLQIATDNWGLCWKAGLLQIVQDAIAGVNALRFGVTQVRVRLFSLGAMSFTATDRDLHDEFDRLSFRRTSAQASDERVSPQPALTPASAAAPPKAGAIGSFSSSARAVLSRPGSALRRSNRGEPGGGGGGGSAPSPLPFALPLSTVRLPSIDVSKTSFRRVAPQPPASGVGSPLTSVAPLQAKPTINEDSERGDAALG